MNRTLQALLPLLLMALLTACTGPEKVKAEPALTSLADATKTAVADTAATAPKANFVNPASALKEAAGLIPQDTVIVGVIDVRYLIEQMLGNGMGIAPQGFDSKPMFDDLSKLFIARFGVDMTKTQWAVFGINEDEQVFIIFKGAYGPAKGFKAIGTSGLSGKELDPSAFLMATGDPNFVVIVERIEGADLLAAVINGNKASLKGRLDKSAMIRVLEKTGPGGLSLAIELGDGDISQDIRNELSMPSYPRAGAVSFSDDVVAVAEGDATALRMIESLISEGVGELRGELAKEMGRINNQDPVEAALVIIAFHMFNAISDAARPKIEGDNLIIEYRTIAGHDQAASLAASFFFMGLMPGMMFMF